MLNLLRKDVFIQKNTLLTAVLSCFFVFVILGHAGANNMFYSWCSVAAFIMAYFFIPQALILDEKNQCEIMLNSLPVTRLEMVTAKYLSIIIVSVSACLIAGVMAWIFNLIPWPWPTGFLKARDFLISFVDISLLAMIYLPLYYKFGWQATRVLNVVLFMMVFFIPGLLKNYILNNQSSQLLLMFKRMLAQPNLFAGMVLAAVLVLLAISYLISLRIYLNKDL